MNGKSRTGSVVGDGVLTHGTLESRDLSIARAFYEDILGLRCVRHSAVSQLLAGRGPVGVVCVETAESAHHQGEENRWVLRAESHLDVSVLYSRARESAGVLELHPISEEDGISRFVMQDVDYNWWEVASLPDGFYQRVFEQGDVHAG